LRRQWKTSIGPAPSRLGRAAAIAGVHPTHFSRAFHHHLGITPNEYRRRARVRLASDLLLGSTISLAQIGLRCGFADQSHFTRTFTTATGIAPSTYRRSFAR
jgi:AraC family transcriptional regulator